MSDSVFLGAYDGERCIGLAILQPGFFKYMYLYDLKVSAEYRRQHIGKLLIQKAKELAVQEGYCGLYTQGQDNNPGPAFSICTPAFLSAASTRTSTVTQSRRARPTSCFTARRPDRQYRQSAIFLLKKERPAIWPASL